jgi:hypothetical protein
VRTRNVQPAAHLARPHRFDAYVTVIDIDELWLSMISLNQASCAALRDPSFDQRAPKVRPSPFPQNEPAT